MERHNQSLLATTTNRGRPITAKDIAHAIDYFEHFLNATSLKNILGYYRSICDLLNLKPNLFPLFYPKLRGHLTTWRAKALWKKFDARAAHKCYGKGKLCAGKRVLIIGAGPCGLRTAIEAQLLGAKVVVIEKRDRLSRNNVLHLWPFVIEDLRALGAKKFFGKFCAGAIDHISIRQLQCILLKVALLLGIEVHTEVSFERLIEPDPVEKTGWRAEFEPANHPVSQYEFDVIIGADGKRNTLQGFKRKEFRGKLAIAITANFINKRTEAEARVEEISGVAFIFNQKFFKELYEATGIDLENIVYYKDDTHYFVMTAKKPSLIDKGVIKQDLADTERLLAPDNVNREALMDYAREAANFSTNYQMPDVEFAVNHYGQPDVAMFDFTSMYAAENASKFVERHGSRLLMILVGDSLLEPFWPTGSGCARGFLSSLDAAWAIRSWSLGTMTALEVLAERESIYRLLAQTTPDNLNKDWKSYTLDPSTRYPNLNKNVVMAHQSMSLFDSDNPKSVERMRRNSQDIAQNDVPKKRRRENVDNEVLLNWISEQVRQYEDATVTDVVSIFREGKVLCAILNYYRPDLLDYSAIKDGDPVKNNQLAIDILEKDIGISPVMTGEEITNTEDYLTMAAYLTQVYDTFRCEIPHIKHPRLPPDFSTLPLPEVPQPAPVSLITMSTTEAVTARQSESLFNIETLYKLMQQNKEDEIMPFTFDRHSVESDIDDDGNLLESIHYKNNDNDFETAMGGSINENVIDQIIENESIEAIQNIPPSQSSIINGEISDYYNSIAFKKIIFSAPENYLRNVHSLDSGGVVRQRHKDRNSWSILTCKNSHKFHSCGHYHKVKFPYCRHRMMSLQSTINDFTTIIEKETNLYAKVSNWINQHNFHDIKKEDLSTISEPDVKYNLTDLDAIDLFNNINDDNDNDLIVEERSDVICCEPNFKLRNLNENKMLNCPSLEINRNFAAEYPADVVVRNEEFELPETKRNEVVSLKNIKAASSIYSGSVIPISRPVSKHKRHADPIVLNKSSSMEKKTRKRRTLEKISANYEERIKTMQEIAANRADRHNKRRQQRRLQTEQFLKSMQMLQANAKPDSQPFEDYSLFVYRQTAPNFEDRVKDLEKKFTYVPDHDSKLPNQTRGNADEDFAARIKNLEEKWREPVSTDKKPKDLLRAIGKIETSDWNIKEIEKKIRENKMGKPSSTNKDKEKVPKWSKEQFIARQSKMEKQHLDRQDSAEAKYVDIDRNIKQLELKLKEGTARDLGQNKVASITEKLSGKTEEPKAVPPPIQKSQSRPAVTLPNQGGSEFCHFCGKRVYLMERLSAEGRFFHHGCFKCQYCHTQLRLGSYAFDRDGLYDHKFFCIHHYGMQGELKVQKAVRKPSQRLNKSPEKKHLSGIAGVDLLDRVRTPERIEFSNLSVGNASSDHEESLSQMDEDEWTDKNFGASAAELGSSDDESSSLSDTDDDDDDEDAYEEALEEPATKEGTMKWAERFTKRYSKHRNDSESDDYSSSDQSSYYENTSDEDDSETATEGEEEIRARELRKQEVRVEPPVVQTDTGTDTEVVSDESSSESSSEIRNSATEISTDSEFAHDDPTPTREIPSIIFNDFNVTKTRGSGTHPKRIQVTSGYLQKPYHKDKKAPKITTTITTTTTTTNTTATSINTKNRDNIELNLTPLVPSAPSLIRKNAPLLLPRTEGYALNRTQSTGGIAAKVSLELKKKYLLGESSGPTSIQKSGSASTLDTKLKSFHTNITDCQKMLKPATTETNNSGIQSFYSKLSEKVSPVTPPTPEIIEEKKSEEIVFENELEGRPRSPVHETSIIVPEIDWSKNKLSHSEDSLSEDSTEEEQLVKPTIPILQVEEFPPDSLTIEQQPVIEEETPKILVANEAPKSISSEKKSLNQPKQLPDLELSVLPAIHNSLHVKRAEPDSETKSGRSTSSDNDSIAEQATAALTETELSDWARDGEVSDDLDDVELEWNMEESSLRSKKKPKVVKVEIPKSQQSEHVCGKFEEPKNKLIITEAINSVLSKNLDNIEFMDTGTETSSDDGIVDSQNGYVLFKNEDDLLAEDSLNPNINDIVEAKNDNLCMKNTGYCILAHENRFGGEVIDLHPEDLEKLKSKNNGEHDEDSLLILDAGTTTEENTCSDSTVKNITEIDTDRTKIASRSPLVDNNNFQRKRLEEKLAKLKAEAKQNHHQVAAEIIPPSHPNENNVAFDEHCQRLQSKIEFGNARDSIDIRKSKRKPKDSPQKPDLIQEESSPIPPKKEITLDLTPTVRTPDVLYKKEYIERERDVNQRLVQEMVMSKLKAENKSLERRKRRGYSTTPDRPYELTKSATTDIVSEINKNNLDSSKNSSGSSIYATPDLLSTLKKSPTVISVPEDDVFSTPLSRPLSVYSCTTQETNVDPKRALFQDDFKTPIAPPRLKHEEAKKTAEKLKQDARVRARLMSNEELGLSPEDKLKKLKEKFLKRDDETIETIVKPDRPNSWLYSNDTLNRKKNGSFKRSKSGDNEANTFRTKSISEIAIENQVTLPKEEKFCKSDPNLLDTDSKKPVKTKDRDRRKSITKLITTFFKKSPSGTSKGIFSRISPKSKDLSKEILREEPVRRKSFSEVSTPNRLIENHSPPPIPPLPLNYTGTSIKGTDESSDGEIDWKKTDRSSCDTLDQSGIIDTSISSSTAKKTNKGARRTARQSQLKRHRMAQEIQRKLEETEVKTRELEERGVAIEKALRGEESGRFSKEESELLQEWFDLMRDRTELRRYEKELMVRAQELELEDRHARLQHELRERLENNEQKTEEDVTIEGAIIKEMMEIVAQRDSLITLLEEDRLRYSNEDRDFEEQVLAKGLRLTPIRKTPEK